MILTQSSTPIIGWIAILLGYIMQFIFNALNAVGIQNIGICIIIFTIIVRLFMLPLTIKQQKFTKLSQAMQPEINKIQKKYKNRKDQASLQKQNQEIQEVYEKYGTSPTGGCAQILVQLPIFLALYQVIRKIPAYIPYVKSQYQTIVSAIGINKESISVINEIAKELPKAYVKKLGSDATANQFIDVMNYFGKSGWTKLASSFPSAADTIADVSAHITKMNTFALGINVTQTPGWRPSVYWIIPILAALFQWLSMKTMPQQNQGNDTTSSMTSSMTWMMPAMSLYFCVIMPAGLGLYWTASAGFQFIQQIVINKMMENADLDEMIRKNQEKAAKKKSKGKKSVTEKIMSKVTNPVSSDDTKSAPVQTSLTYYANINTKNLKAPTIQGSGGKDYYSVLDSIDHDKLGEISQRAYSVAKYEKEHGNTKGGKK
ncbi:MAG: membrane protein insertase YidC [Eubacterium sp.]|nr:membrane protein insertase YidC [Eubacterium sp.]